MLQIFGTMPHIFGTTPKISGLRAGSFPVMWRREWCTPILKPKDGGDLKTCDNVRKVASTSDFAKIFELFLRGWVTEDIGN